MKRLLWAFTLAGALGLLGSPALAGDWLSLCVSGDTTTSLQPGEVACYQPASNSDDSELIYLFRCENVSFRWFPDSDGDGTATTVTPTVRCCPMGLSAADSDACWILENITFDGDPSTNTEAIYGADAWSCYVDMPATGTIADPQMDISCNGPDREQ